MKNDKSHNRNSNQINQQLNYRNKLITKKFLQSILNSCDIYEEINNLELYIQAFTHKSYIQNNLSISSLRNLIKLYPNYVPYQKKSYERLEFLGDSVIGHVVCEYLYNRYPSSDEGFLTKLKTKLVDRKALAKFARFLNFSEYILISNHMENIHGRDTDKILEDVYEAFICALNTDLGFSIAKKFIVTVMEKTTNFASLLFNDSNYKDRILRYFQKNGWQNPTYSILNTIGPAHKRSFTVSLNKFDERTKSNIQITEGTGYSKKDAEQIASKNALKKYNIF